MPAEPDIGAGELEILKVLWDLGPSTVREVLDELRARRRRLAYNTVQTVLRRLTEKDFVQKDDRSHSHVFRARVTREKIGRRRIRDLLHGVYDGAAGSMVMQLVRNGRLEPGEIDLLQRMLDDLGKLPKKAHGKRRR